MADLDPLLDVGDHWYEVVNDDTIRQGDLFLGLLALWFPDDLAATAAGAEGGIDVEIQFERGDWIVLSASCDAQPARSGAAQQQVLIGRVYPCTEEHLSNVRSSKDLNERVEVLRRGFDPLRHLLAAHTSQPKLPLSFVVWRLQLTLPLEYLKRCCNGPRLRMRTPHRERFGNWAGSCIARVGIEDSEQVAFVKDRSLYPAQVLRSVAEE